MNFNPLRRFSVLLKSIGLAAIIAGAMVWEEPASLAGKHPLPEAARVAPATLTVDIADDENDSGCVVGDCSLREAVASAGNGDTINFASSLSGQTIKLTLGEIEISKSIAIVGPGADKLTVSGNNSSRVFNITGGDVTISGLKIANGLNTSLDILGGGIFNSSSATLTMTNCTVSGNSGTTGGGIRNEGTLKMTNCTVSENSSSFGSGGGILNFKGTLTMTNCTVSGNSSDTEGGGIENFGGTLTMTNCTVSGNSSAPGNDGGGIATVGTATMTNCTVSGNSGGGFGGGGISNSTALTMTNCTVSRNRSITFGGGIRNGGITLNLKNSIVANNSARDGGPDISGPVNSGDFNLIGDTSGISGSGLPGSNNITNQDPKLAPLGNYGGPTQTHALMCGSPAIDKGSNDLAKDPDGNKLETDQRGSTRIVNKTVDMGAFEANIFLSPTSLPDALINSSYSQTLSATGGSGNYTFSFGTGSSLPPGLTLSKGGTISGTPTQAGTFSFIIVATDSGGFAGACQYSLKVSSSSSAPSITCPGNITVNADPGKCSASVNFSVLASGDPTPTVTCTANDQTISSPATFPVGQTTVTCTANNSSGTASCEFTVEVKDVEKPSIFCPSDITVVTRPGESSAVVNFSTPAATDNCGGTPNVSCTPSSGSSFSVGVSTVTCKATDSSGNIAQCSFRVVVSAFDLCLQDDSDRSRVLLINSQTGDYVFCCGGEAFAGRGQINQKGGLISLQHFGTDRRVVANIDLGFGRGSATLQFPPGVIRCTIMDRNTRDNNCGSCASR